MIRKGVTPATEADRQERGLSGAEASKQLQPPLMSKLLVMLFAAFPVASSQAFADRLQPGRRVARRGRAHRLVA